ncbi:UNVERIFIED_ORG: hypothetical protein GGE44_000894 [Rhizobium esperanzae]
MVQVIFSNDDVTPVVDPSQFLQAIVAVLARQVVERIAHEF